MANASISPLAVTSPTAQATKASQASFSASDSADTPNFYQVLQQRAANAQKQPDSAAKTPAQQQNPQQNQASASKDTAQGGEQSAPPSPHVTLLMMIDLPGSAIKSDKAALQADDKADPLAQNLLGAGGDLSAAAAALAADAARLAGAAGNTAGEALAGQAGGRGVDPDLRGKGAEEPLLLGKSDAHGMLQALGEDSAKQGKVGESGERFANLLNTAQNHAAGTTAAQHGINVRPTDTAPLPRHEIATPVGARDWADEVSQKVSWVASRDNGRAELVLNPAHLGRVEVSINLNGEHATASFVAANQAARDALQEALPRLREVLADSGIQLGQATVDAGTSGQPQGDAQQQQASQARNGFARYGNAGGTASEPMPAMSARIPVRSGNGMVDTFA